MVIVICVFMLVRIEMEFASMSPLMAVLLSVESVEVMNML